MKLFIPAIGDKICLTKAWTFHLHDEKRNAALWSYLFPDDEDIGTYSHAYAGDWVGGAWVRRYKYKPREITIPKGSVLTVDRLYVRKGAKDFDSISFFLTKDSPLKNKKVLRFWAKLNDVNKIECKLVEEPASESLVEHML